MAKLWNHCRSDRVVPLPQRRFWRIRELGCWRQNHHLFYKGEQGEKEIERGAHEKAGKSSPEER